MNIFNSILERYYKELKNKKVESSIIDFISRIIEEDSLSADTLKHKMEEVYADQNRQNWN